MVEVKHSSINNIVQISSIHQLNPSRGMILAVFELSEDESGENLEELVEKIINENSIDEFVFEDLLLSAGYLREKNNFNKRLKVKNEMFYTIDERFPIIEKDSIKGIVSANYSVDCFAKNNEIDKINVERYLDNR